MIHREVSIPTKRIAGHYTMRSYAPLTGCAVVGFSLPAGSQGVLLNQSGREDASVKGSNLFAMRQLAQSQTLWRSRFAQSQSGSCFLHQLSQPMPSPSPSKRCGSGGKTVKCLYEMLPQSRSGGGGGTQMVGYDGSQFACSVGCGAVVEAGAGVFIKGGLVEAGSLTKGCAHRPRPPSRASRSSVRNKS